MEEKKIELKPEYFLSEVKTRLDKLGFSQKDFANAIGVSQNTISSWFSDNKKMQPHGLHLILSIIEFFINHPLKVGENEIDFNPASLFVSFELNPIQKEIQKLRSRNYELRTKLDSAEKERDELKPSRDYYKKKYEKLLDDYRNYAF